jgi:hypothetical protein
MKWRPISCSMHRHDECVVLSTSAGSRLERAFLVETDTFAWRLTRIGERDGVLTEETTSSQVRITRRHEGRPRCTASQSHRFRGDRSLAIERIEIWLWYGLNRAESFMTVAVVTLMISK